MAFVFPALPWGATSRLRHLHSFPVAREEHPSPFSLDTLANFESFCWRAQDWLCSQAAAADGLGTFRPIPSAYNSVPKSDVLKKKHRMMMGGRAFDTALVTVWTSAELGTSRRHVPTWTNCHRATVDHVKDAVGVSVKFQPRDPSLPSLRADAHYFQIGGGRLSWWFTGTADISMGAAANPEIFQESLQPFFGAWENLRKRHRKSTSHARRAFLNDCFNVGEHSSVRDGGLDQLTAYNFITEMVDALLPAYLPLLLRNGKKEKASNRIDRFWNTSLSDVGNSYGHVEVDNFFIEGGAACESVTVRSSPLGSWRFSLAPSSFTSAGRVYAILRDDYGGTDDSFPLL